VIIHQLDYQFDGLSIISVVVWLYTIALLAVGVFLYLLRIFLYPQHVVSALRTSVTETSCLASISITFTSIIIMAAVVLVRQWGSAWGIVVYVLWWINTAMAVGLVMWIPYVYVKVQPPGLEAVSPGVLLPLISALTSAAGGGIICRYGALSDRLQIPVIIVSYLEVGIGLPLAVTLSGVFVTRLFNKSFPSVEHVYEDMILCGPFGQGSFALQALGQVVSRGSFAGYGRGTFLTAEAAKPVAFVSQFAGLLSWGYATFWWVFAITSILHTFFSQIRDHRSTPFTMTAWAVVFPWVRVEPFNIRHFLTFSLQKGCLYECCGGTRKDYGLSSLQGVVDRAITYLVDGNHRESYLHCQRFDFWKTAGSQTWLEKGTFSY
jgi:tellurite resistance protein TehA-like permease